MKSTLHHQVWDATFPDQVSSYQFLEETLAQLYEKEQIVSRLTRAFALISIMICCLALIGLATYIARQRTQEIGIRKVLGASVRSLLLLLSKEYLRLLLIAFAVAVPVANYFMNDWLRSFVYRIDVTAWLLLSPGLLIFAITMLTISTQTLRAATRNPVDSLRDE